MLEDIFEKPIVVKKDNIFALGDTAKINEQVDGLAEQLAEKERKDKENGNS